MKNLEKNVELLSQYLESVFETYSVKNVGKKQSLELEEFTSKVILVGILN